MTETVCTIHRARFNFSDFARWVLTDISSKLQQMVNDICINGVSVQCRYTLIPKGLVLPVEVRCSLLVKSYFRLGLVYFH